MIHSTRRGNRQANDGACNGRGYRPFLAFLVPLVAVLGIVWAGEGRKNLRETFTFIAAALQASIVLSMVPAVLGGLVSSTMSGKSSRTLSSLASGWTRASFRLRRVHSGIATTTYAIGYMRGLYEHAQTRFYRFSQYPFRQRWYRVFSQLADHLFL